MGTLPSSYDPESPTYPHSTYECPLTFGTSSAISVPSFTVPYNLVIESMHGSHRVLGSVSSITSRDCKTLSLYRCPHPREKDLFHIFWNHPSHCHKYQKSREKGKIIFKVSILATDSFQIFNCLNSIKIKAKQCLEISILATNSFHIKKCLCHINNKSKWYPFSYL